MPAIHLNHLSFSHSRAVDLLAAVEAHLGPGWTGVVGANGTGKTTLLRLITGDLCPDSGGVITDPADAVVILCEQVVDDASADVRVLASSWEPPDVALRGRLGLEPDDLGRWTTLSPGERKRWQVGAALARQPDVLLLDEPTNHLDGDSRDQLVAALKRFGGVGLLVSHDRTLLNELTVRTLRIDRGGVILWKAPYDDARRAWDEAEAERLAAYEHLKLERRKAEKRLADQRQTNEQKRAAFRRRNNTASFKDIDSRSAARQSKHREGEKAAGANLASAAKAAERARQAVDDIDTHKTVGAEVAFDHAPSPKRLLASYSGQLVVGDHILVDHVDLDVNRDDRIWLRGPNGAGKTTLLTALVDSASVPAERILHIRQELRVVEGVDLLRQLSELDHQARGRVLQIVAALGLDPELLLATEEPSPGETRKLAIALGLGRQAWLVALDEPTNHLDLPSVERLERALAAYPGALVVVSHDEAFAARLELRPFDLIRT